MRTMRPLRSLVVALAFGGALPTFAHAQIEAGDKRFSLQGNLSKSTAAGSDLDGDLSGEIGWYWKRNISLNAGAGVTFSGANAFYLLAVGSEYNFSEKGDTKVPFVSLNVGTLFGNGITAIVAQPGVGAHFFLSPQTSFDVTGTYTYTFVKVSGASGNDGTIGVNFGFSFYFGPGEKR